MELHIFHRPAEERRPISKPSPFALGTQFTERFLDYADAVEVIKEAEGVMFFLHVTQFAPSKDQDGAPPETPLGKLVYANVEVTRKAVLKFLDHAFSEQTKAVCNVRISEGMGCMFVGAMARGSSSG